MSIFPTIRVACGRRPSAGIGGEARSIRVFAAGLAAGLVVAAVATSAEAETRSMTLERAIDVAMEHNDQVEAAEAEVNQQRASYRGATASFGPTLNVETNVQRWDEPQTTEFSAPGGGGGAEITVREQTTTNLSATVAQPLTPLLSLYESQRVEKIGLKQAKTSQRQTRRDVALSVIEAYFRLLQARSVRRVAEQSLERRKEQLERTKRFREAEQVPKNDVLRAEVGVSRSEQRLIEAKGQVDVAEAQLRRVLGASETSGEASLEPTSDVSLDYTPPADVDRAIELAVKRRASVRSAALSIDQASAGIRAARSNLLPKISAIATYQRSYGSAFSNNESFFIGANLQWTVWEWGAKNFEVQRAKAQRRRAKIGRSRLVKGIELEVKNAYTNFETTRQSLEVARRAASQAQENYRAEKKRYEAKLSTSIDLLDAETQLTETRTNVQNAKYEHYIAAATLRRALGLAPWTGDE